MRKNKVVLLYAMIFIISCEEDVPKPRAGFKFPNFNGEIYGADITFSNDSKNARSYTWDFGDGTTSTEKNPKHTYYSNGTFTVRLVAVGPGGSDIKEAKLIVANVLIGLWSETSYSKAECINTSENKTFQSCFTGCHVLLFSLTTIFNQKAGEPHGEVVGYKVMGDSIIITGWAQAFDELLFDVGDKITFTIDRDALYDKKVVTINTKKTASNGNCFSIRKYMAR